MEKTALIFPGQGCQYIGMGKSIFDEYNVAREVFEEANEVLGFNLSKLCFEGGFSELNRLRNMLLSIFTVSVALYKVFEKEVGINPEFVAGHSLGEYTALTCSGVFTFSDALKIVDKRSMIAKKYNKQGHMTIVNDIGLKDLTNICKEFSNHQEYVSIACSNTAKQYVISGHDNKLDEVGEKLINMGAQITPFMMSPPFHSKIMASAKAELLEEIEKYSIQDAKWPIISNVTATATLNSQQLIQNLADQMCSEVRWNESMRFIINSDIHNIIEIGPQKILGNLIHNPKINVLAYGKKNDRDNLSISVIAKRKENYRKFIKKCVKSVVCTPNYNVNYDEYKSGVIIPYERLEKLLQSNTDIYEDDEKTVAEIMNLVKLIFITKKVPILEQKTRYKEIIKDMENYDNDWLDEVFLAENPVRG
ncbi:hypothetical protein SH1V18_36690 [Vallitalea longa]|uniref:[acyl-carrier-protein] S-malonyltransferase n=1 Tax=Vallitalea longa TaxID=2936439 RepID=A0A9W6DHT6_9FIRM|nr:ACP S-malonyltransferase [Vallitalea longa]GKX31189.1 hypothetical protein SH1V18_36690 [Vallitalea longa]